MFKSSPPLSAVPGSCCDEVLVSCGSTCSDDDDDEVFFSCCLVARNASIAQGNILTGGFSFIVVRDFVSDGLVLSGSFN